MADLSMLYTPQAMQTAGQLPLMYTVDAARLLKQNQQTDQATLEELMKARQRTQEMHGADLAQKSATLAGTQLGNQARQLQNEGLGMDNRVRKETLPQEIQAKLDKFAKEADDYKWSQFESKIKNGLQSQDPKARAQAQALYDQLPAQIDTRTKHKQAMEKEREASRRTIEAARIAATSRENVQGMKSPSSSGMPDFNKIKDPLQQYTAIVRYIAEVQAENPDDPRIPKLIAMKTAVQPVAQELIDRGRDRIGMAPDAGGNWKPSQGTQLADTAPPTASPAKAPPTQADIEFTAKKYGITVEEVKKRLGM
jgi:hypothetical protein